MGDETKPTRPTITQELLTNESCPRRNCATNVTSSSVILSVFSRLPLSEDRLPRESDNPNHELRRNDATLLRIHCHSSSGYCFSERHWITISSYWDSKYKKSIASISDIQNFLRQLIQSPWTISITPCGRPHLQPLPTRAYRRADKIKIEKPIAT